MSARENAGVGLYSSESEHAEEHRQSFWLPETPANCRCATQFQALHTCDTVVQT